MFPNLGLFSRESLLFLIFPDPYFDTSDISHCFRQKIPCPSCTSWPAHQVLKPRSWTSPVPAQNPRGFIGFPLKIGCPKKKLWIISLSYHGLASFFLWSGSKLGPHFKIFQGNIENDNSHEFLSTRLKVLTHPILSHAPSWKAKPVGFGSKLNIMATYGHLDVWITSSLFDDHQNRARNLLQRLDLGISSSFRLLLISLWAELPMQVSFFWQLEWVYLKIGNSKTTMQNYCCFFKRGSSTKMDLLVRGRSLGRQTQKRLVHESTFCFSSLNSFCTVNLQKYWQTGFIIRSEPSEMDKKQKELLG